MQFDKKKYEDFNFPYTIECLDLYNDDIIKGIAFNISKSCVCLYIPQSMDKGQEITIKSVVCSFSQKATVCWSEKYENEFYEVGCYLHDSCF